MSSTAWSEVALGDVLIESKERIELAPTTEYQQVTVQMWGKGVVQRDIVTGLEISAKTRRVVRAGQFLLSRIDARHGAFGLVPSSLDGAIVSNDFPSFDLEQSRLIPEFLEWLSRTRGFVDLCLRASEGTTNRVRLQIDRFLDMRIRLPHSDEQRRIVARIEELAVRIEEAHGLRQRAVEEAEALLTSSYDVVFNEDRWEQVALGSLLRENSRNGISTRPENNPPGTPILRISAATSRLDAVIDEGDHKYLPVDDRTLETYRLEPGDLLACRFNGNLHYVGRFALYQGYQERTHVYPDKLIRFRMDTGRLLPEFTRLAVNSPVGRRQIEEHCATTAGNIGISATKLKTIRVPVPPIEEQRDIVTYLEDLQSHVDELKRLQAETTAELDALLPSILDKAFKGELLR